MSKLGNAIKYCTERIAKQDKDSEILHDIRELLYELDEHKSKQSREVTAWH